MRDWIAKMTPSSWLARKSLMAAVLIGACVGAFCWGRKQSVEAGGKGPFDQLGKTNLDRRIVAYLWQNTPVTREELGEYLIERFGTQRLEFLVNRKIVELECRKHNISVSDAEVEQRFRRDLESFGKLPLTPRDFEEQVLRRFNKTMFEWKEDVIRPKILMEKLVHSQIKVSEQDVRDGFEARYGPKVDCRMIVMQAGNIAAVNEAWNKAKQGPEHFLKVAESQFLPNLQGTKGKVPPIHRHFGDKLIEETAFRLKEGEVSEPLKMQDHTYVILMCERRLPADITAKYENERLRIQREVEELKIAQEIPLVFNKLRNQANPRLVLDNAVSHMARSDGQPRTGVSAFDQVPNMPQTIHVPPAPTPMEVRPPTGTVPVLPSGVAPQPINPITLPKLDPPTDKK